MDDGTSLLSCKRRYSPDVHPHDLGRLQNLAHGPHQGPVDAREGAAVEGVSLVEDDAHLFLCGVVGIRRLGLRRTCGWRMNGGGGVIITMNA